VDDKDGNYTIWMFFLIKVTLYSRQNSSAEHDEVEFTTPQGVVSKAETGQKLYN